MEFVTRDGCYKRCRKHDSNCSIFLLHDVRLDDGNLVYRPILSTSLDEAHALYNLQSALDPAKDGVFAVQPGRWCEGDEELQSSAVLEQQSRSLSYLAAVCVRSTVRHAQNASSSVLQRREDLVLELFTVYRGAAAACACGVTTLDHEVRDDAVEDNAVVVAALCQPSEIPARLWRVLVVQLDRDGALEKVSESTTTSETAEESCHTIVVSSATSFDMLVACITFVPLNY
jgi:hypothetical protein